VLLLPVTVKVALRASLSRHSALFTIAGGVLLFAPGAWAAAKWPAVVSNVMMA
jgi:hypothetical protein